jgi:anti-sigma regulatory factor (Ser/Thr protein kinase)
MDTPNLARAVVADQTHLRILSRPDWIEPTVTHLLQRALLSGACTESRADRLLLALHEGVTNAVIHGNLEIDSDLKEREDNTFIEKLAVRAADPHFHRRTVDIVVSYDGQRCQWTIVDQGPGFDVEGVLARAGRSGADQVPSGRGLLLMRNFMDEMRYEDGGRKLILVLEHESAERRHERRQASRAPLRLVPIRADGTIDWDAAHAAVARNLSEGGVGLIRNELARTDRILIGLTVGDRPLYIPAEVRHWRTLGGDLVELGCRFSPGDDAGERGLPAEAAAAIARLLERAPPLRDADRRSHPRVLFTERIEIVTAAEQPPLVGYARDLSKAGIAFLTTAPLPREVILVFAPAAAEPPLRVRTEVVHCAKVQEGFYDVGGRFRGLVPHQPAERAE